MSQNCPRQLVITAYPAAITFGTEQSFLPTAIALAHVMAEAKITGQFSGTENLTEHGCAGSSSPQMVLKRMPNTQSVHAVRPQPLHNRSSLSKAE